MSRRTSRSHSFLRNVLTLSGATAIVKLISALFKIPLANILGGLGMSYFVSAYDIFTPVYAFTVTGLGVAISRCTAEYAATGPCNDVIQVLYVGRRICTVIGFAAMLLILFVARPFSAVIGNEEACCSIIAIAPAVFFSCLSAAYRGYFQGLSDMTPTACSQVIEALVKLTAGVGGALLISHILIKQHAAHGYLFGIPLNSQQSSLSLTAAAAVSGITLSTMAGAFYIRECCRENRCFNFTRSKTEHEARRSIARRLIRVALPVSLAGLLVNLSMIIDLVTVVNCLKTALQTDLQTVFSRYAGMLPPEITEQTLPSYLYGSYSGLTLSLFNLIPAFTTALGSSAIPSVTRLYVSGRNSDLSVMITAILKLTFLIAVPAGLGISALAGPILQLLYAGRPYEVLIVIPILKLLGVASMLSAVSIPLNSILQALGRERIPLYLLCGGALIKLSLNILLISRPEINILGVAFGTLGCYLFITLGSLFFLKKQKGIRIPLISIITKPFLGGLLCVSAARIVYARTCTIFSNTGSVCLAILCAVAVYGTVVFLMGAISIGEIKMLFAREKYPVNGLH